MKALIIRFGSLGDLVLTFPALRDLAASGGSPIHYLAHEEYRELLAPLPEIQRIWTLPRGASRSALAGLAASLDDEGFDLVLDLHSNLRSRMLKRGLKGSRPLWASTRREDLTRRLMISRRGWPSAWRPRRLLAPVSGRHREALRAILGPAYRAAAEGLYEPGEALRAEVASELAELGLDAAARPLGLAPGSAWPAKVWPHFSALIARLAPRSPMLLFGGPLDAPLCRDLAATGGAIAYCGDRPLPKVAAALAHCRLLVTGDTGLGHLAEAVGRPVLSFFGPTVPAFGFAPALAASRILQRDLACRPCSLHGEKPCRYGHHACLAGIEVETVLAVLAEMEASLG